MLTQRLIFLFILPLVEDSLYLYRTDDSASVEFYDCIIDSDLPYCRRPSEPITLQRDQSNLYCDHDGISHSFASLMLKNVSVSTVLHQWRSSIEKAEEYSRYKNHAISLSSDEKYLCQCRSPQSFGKHCEYLLPVGITFQETIDWEIEMRRKNKRDIQMYSDIVCYTTLICDSGLLCLDWRDICDGIQHCMFGYDEENCDKLEFNECEENEYRCANGMCVPDEYFLDGEYDCLDLTDEQQLFYDQECTFEQASVECDDRVCLRSQWSCGDGQCISDRLHFQKEFSHLQCSSFREQYHMCELHYYASQWTLPNGKCYSSSDYEEIVTHPQTDSEKCLYFIKCVLSGGAEKNCPRKNDTLDIHQWQNLCSSSMIQYPNRAIIAPYVVSLYNTTRDWSHKRPDSMKINGTIKCRGYLLQHQAAISYRTIYDLNKLEVQFCQSETDISISINRGYDKFCYNDSRTFNNRSYNFIDICADSHQCISAYRIHDGNVDCVNEEDESEDAEEFLISCSNIRRHRFRCSDVQPTCLLVNKIGDWKSDCKNFHDEWWIEKDLVGWQLTCHSESKKDCHFIRQYVEESWISETNVSVDQTINPPKTPFRALCDTFWYMGSKEDENIELCRKWWKCLDDQWQCHSGQCIEKEWVLDREWDCVDASDEEGLFFHYSNLSNDDVLRETFDGFYSNQSFWNLCDFNVEYPCFRANVSDPLNVTLNRPCIRLDQIGDDHIDCAGGIDERNTLKHCNSPTMLGNYFQCSSTNTCIAYLNQCDKQCEDNRVQCYGYKRRSDCLGELDFLCLNGECVTKGWCNQIMDCSYGEDELFCFEHHGSLISIVKNYREGKEPSIENRLQLPRLPRQTIDTQINSTILSIRERRSILDDMHSEINSSIAYYCNRGIAVHSFNQSIVCFCPPQYNGDRCQYHLDRLTFLFHLNLSRSIYTESSDAKTALKFLVIFSDENEILITESFQIQIIDEMKIPRKKLLHLFYSRSNRSLTRKRLRYFNRSDIIHQHPYSIRIEAYELKPSEKIRLVAVWFYSIYLDFLPSFRLAKILYLFKPDPSKNPCSSNPCRPYEECHPILNDNFNYLCLCPSNFKGNDCSIMDKMCQEGFCSADGLCKSMYRGFLNGNEQPYCICSLNKLGDRCDLIHDQCHSNPCQNNGACLSTMKPNEFYCLCDDYHYGDVCQFEKRAVRLYVNKSLSHRAAVVQYFDIDFVTLNLHLVHQRIYLSLPDRLLYLHAENTAPRIILIKLYSNMQSEIYLISIQIEMESINGTIEISEENRCVHLRTLFPTNEGMRK